jgi:hypothetical protein
MTEQLAGLHHQTEFMQVEHGLYWIGKRKACASLSFKQWIGPKQRVNDNDCELAFVVGSFEGRIKLSHEPQVHPPLGRVQNEIKSRRSMKIEV